MARLPRRPATSDGSSPTTNSPSSHIPHPNLTSLNHFLSRATSVRHLKENTEHNHALRRFENSLHDVDEWPGKRKMSSSSATASPVLYPALPPPQISQSPPRHEGGILSWTGISSSPIASTSRKRPSLSVAHLPGQTFGSSGSIPGSSPITLTNGSYNSFSSLTPDSDRIPQHDASPAMQSSSTLSSEFDALRLPPSPKQKIMMKRGKKHHAYGENVPYPMSYEATMLDHDVIDNQWFFEISHSICYTTFPDGPPKRVLDLGCGTGTWVLAAAEQWKDTYFIGFDLAPIQPDLDLLDPDPAEDETAKTKLLHALAQPPVPSPVPTTAAAANPPSQADTIVPSSSPPSRPGDHVRSPGPSSGVHPFPTSSPARRGRSASTASSSPFTSTSPYRPYTNQPTSSSLMNLTTVNANDTAVPPLVARSQSHQHQPTTSMGRKSLEALVAGLPENVLYGEESSGVPSSRPRLKSHPNVYPGFKPKRRRSPGRLRLGQRVKWVHGNFLEPLPFPDGYFDYVRLRRIARGIPERAWDGLFLELNRVLRIGGMIEVIENDLLFPGGSFPSSAPQRSNKRNSAMGFSLSSPIESTGKRNRDPNGRPAFIGRLKPNSSSADADDSDDPVSPGSPPLVSLAGAYTPNLKPKHPGDPPVPGAGETFFHNGYGHGFVTRRPVPAPPRDSMRSPPRVVVPPLQTTASPRQSEKHTPPMTSTTGLSVAQSAVIDDPRDHSILESIYLSLHESRFINLRPLLIIPSYLDSFFGQLKTHPALLLLAPDRKVDGPGLAGGRPDEGEGTPCVNGIIDNLSARAFAARAIGMESPAPVVLGGDFVMPNSAETLIKNAQQQQSSPATASASRSFDQEKSLSPIRASARQHGAGIATSSRSRSSTGAGLGGRSQSTVADQRQLPTFVEDYMAIDPTRPMRRVEVAGRDSVTVGTLHTLPQRYFKYDVGHAGLVLSVELANVLACVEDMWEHARSLDPEAQRSIFDAKVEQYVTDIRNRINLARTLEARLHWEGRDKGQPEHQKAFEAKLQHVLQQEDEELFFSAPSSASETDEPACSSPLKSSQEKRGRRHTQSSLDRGIPPTSVVRKPGARRILNDYHHYANGRMIIRAMQVWCAVKEETYEPELPSIVRERVQAKE